MEKRRFWFQWVVTTLLVAILDQFIINNQPLLSPQDITKCRIELPQGWYHWQPCTFDIDGAMAFFVSVGGNYLVGCHFGQTRHQQSAFALTTRRHDMQNRITSRMVPLAAL